MSIIDWLIVGLSIVGTIVLVAAGFIGWLVWCVIRETDDPDELPAPPLVRTKIIGPQDFSMARAAAEAGYISNKEYVDRVAEVQADALALDLSVFTQKTFQRPARIQHAPDWNGAA